MLNSRSSQRTISFRASEIKSSAAARAWPHGPMAPVVLIRHAEPLVAGETPGAEWPLTEKGRNDASVLGTSIADRSTNAIVLTSPERRARETAALALPLLVAGVRDQLGEVKKPWYASADEHRHAIAEYIKGKVVEGWERREDVISRVSKLKSDIGSSESLVLVSHGLLLTTWLDHEIGLHDPLLFWSNLRMPDAWVADFEDKSLERIVASR
jgi:broad specificity phosphatase PhoE